MEDQEQAVIPKLLKRMDSGSGFAGLGASVQTISLMDDDADGGVKDITATILRDAALTSKLLRLSNASSRGARNVSTIDQAIAILGLNTVKSVAISLALLDSLSNKPQSNQLHAEIVAAYFCGTLSTMITRRNGPRYNAQESQVCGLLQNLGRMMATYYLYDDIEASRTLQSEKDISEEEAVVQTLGSHFDDIGAAIAQHWNLPDVLQQSLAFKLGKAPPRPATSSIGWQQLCTVFARRITDILFRVAASKEKVEIGQEIAFFRQALHLKEDETQEWIEKALEETDALLSEISFPSDVEQSRTLLRKASEQVLDVLSSQDSLTKSTRNSDGKTPIEVIHQILRLIHDEYKFDLTLLCLPTGTSGLIAISGVGRNANQVAQKFRCQGAKPDIFRLIMGKKMDVYVADIHAATYAKFIPEWYPDVVGARSFLAMSLVHNDQFLGLLYGDYTAQQPVNPQNQPRTQVQGWRDQLIKVLQG